MRFGLYGALAHPIEANGIGGCRDVTGLDVQPLTAPTPDRLSGTVCLGPLRDQSQVRGVYVYSPSDRIARTTVAYPAAFPVGVLPTNENDTGLVVKTSSVDAFRADGTQLDPTALGDPAAFTGNGYMLLGLEIDGLASRYRDDSARRGGPLMVLAAPSLPGRGLSHACSVYGASCWCCPRRRWTPSRSGRRCAPRARSTRPCCTRRCRWSAPMPGCGRPVTETGPTEWGETAGVGPWQGPPPADPRYDPALLRDGDTRNVVDAYRYWTREAIIADIDKRRHRLHIAIENFGNDANIGAVVRTANAFAVDTVHIVGRRRWNRRGAMVTDRYQRLWHHETTADLLAFADDNGLVVVAVDNVPGAVRLEHTTLPAQCLLIFGQEGPGITEDTKAGAALTVSIAQFGSTRSINAAVAAGIAMHTWIGQHADLNRAW